MSQNPCKTLGFKKLFFTKFPLGEVNHIQPVAYHNEDLTTLLSVSTTFLLRSTSSCGVHPIFQGHSKSVVECEEGIKCSSVFGTQPLQKISIDPRHVISRNVSV